MAFKLVMISGCSDELCLSARGTMQWTHGAQVGEKTIVELLRSLVLPQSVPLKD